MGQTIRFLMVTLMVGSAFAAGGWTRAQTQVPPRIVPQPPQVRPHQEQPLVLSGDDIGFRVERWNGEVPVGRLIVRVDGKWVEPQLAMGVQRVTPK